MIKLITSIKPSDNGNKFLCETCNHARMRSGTQTQMQILCTAPSGPDVEITFRVTQCSDYQQIDVWEQQPLRNLAKQAWTVEYLHGALTLLPPNHPRNMFGNPMPQAAPSGEAEKPEPPPKPN